MQRKLRGWLGVALHMPSPDDRHLLGVAWLYLIQKTYFVSNHLQIILWDTVEYHMEEDKKHRVDENQLFDACVTRRRLRAQKAIERWKSLMEQALLEACH